MMMMMNSVIALILRYFTEFDCFAGELRHSDRRQTYNVCKIFSPRSSLPLLAQTNPPCSTVSVIAELLVHNVSDEMS